MPPGHRKLLSDYYANNGCFATYRQLVAVQVETIREERAKRPGHVSLLQIDAIDTLKRWRRLHALTLRHRAVRGEIVRQEGTKPMAANATLHVVSTKADPVDVHVGSRVRAARLLANISQETLADKCDITFQQIQKYESGANRVSASRLVQIARATGRPVGFFFEGLPEYPVADEMTTEAITFMRLFNRLDAAQQGSLVTIMRTMQAGEKAA